MKKTKRMPKILAFLLAVIMMLSATPISALATGVDSIIDNSIVGSITLYKRDADTGAAIEGVGYTLYQVATITQTTEDGNSVTTFDELYTPNAWYTFQNGTYAGQQVYMPEIDEINSLNSYKFNTLVIAALAEMGLLTIAEVTSGTDGKIVFPNLDSGYVYLAVESTTPSGTTAANNFLITVPMYYAAGTKFDVDIILPDGTTLAAGNSLDEDMWIYDVVAFPKNDIDASTNKKTYVDGKEVDSVEYGQVFTYEVTTSIPGTLYPYIESGGTTMHYYDSYIIKDTAGKNIEYVLNSGIVNATVTLWNGSADPDNPDKIKELVANIDYVLTYDANSNSFGIELIDQTISDWTAVTDGQITSYYNDGRGYQDGDYLVITYEAIIVGNDKTNTADTTNTVIIDTDGSDGEYTIPGTEKNTETYDYRVWKVGEDNDDTHTYGYVGLEDAEFALLDTDGNYMGLYAYDVDDGTGNIVTKYEWVTFDNENAWKAKDVSQSNSNAYSNGNTSGNITTKFTSNKYGLFKLEGLAAGTYKLMEVTAPGGYTLLADVVEITVGAASDTKANEALNVSTVDEANVILDASMDNSNYFSIYIINKSTGAGGNWTLPTTGDMGIGLFIIVGGVLMAAAVSLYAYNRKKNGKSIRA